MRCAEQAWVCLVICLITFFAPECRAQAQHSTEHGPLKVTLSLDKTQLTVGEPLVFGVKLENTRVARPIDISASFQFPEGNGIRLIIQPENELEYRYSGAIEEGVYTALPVSVSRGTPRDVYQMVLFNRKTDGKLAFPKPGRYVVTASFEYHLSPAPEKHRAVLPPVTIEVSEATPADAAILARSTEPEFLRSLHLGIATDTATLTLLRGMVDDPAFTVEGSNLAPLALRACGYRMIASDFAAEEQLQGIAYLRRYLEATEKPFDGDGIVWSIAGAYHLMKRYDLAREWMFYGAVHYPNSPRIRPEDALYKYYIADPMMFASSAPWYLLQSPWVVPGQAAPENLKPVQESQ